MTKKSEMLIPQDADVGGISMTFIQVKINFTIQLKSWLMKNLKGFGEDLLLESGSISAYSPNLWGSRSLDIMWMTEDVYV